MRLEGKSDSERLMAAAEEESASQSYLLTKAVFPLQWSDEINDSSISDLIRNTPIGATLQQQLT